MKVYDIITPFNYGQTHSVVADSIAEAERAFLAEYPQTKIERIELHAEYVIVATRQDR